MTEPQCTVLADHARGEEEVAPKELRYASREAFDRTSLAGVGLAPAMTRYQQRELTGAVLAQMPRRA
ncbi:hypothetical protein PsYK624_087750 [Phanerochaete sordida]|uniref:Uncharacterized protein n=1 Tax=Phanerochaete sordida TaxID=48140 RepID=A0A9P3LEU3_9APHY|nr:hypothetical protein PsYK624_087750 [Phanerochaete sordida]